jgi:hypothetical protein
MLLVHHTVLPPSTIWQIFSYAMALAGLELFLYGTVAVLLMLKCRKMLLRYERR